jgi:hypothetical protein
VSKPHRVIQWATGSIGKAQLREIIERPDLELVGAFVYGADKVGVDAGTLCGLPATGILATNSKDEILALDADVVTHAATKYGPFNDNTDDIERLLRSGKNVISTTTYNHLPTFGGGVQQRFEAACQAGRSSFMAAGENPGFMMQRLAATVTGLSKRVDHIALEEYFECSWIDSPSMVFDGMMMGAPPEKFTLDAPAMAKNSLQYQQELGATADVLGITLDEIVPAIEVTTLDRDLTVTAGVIRAGTVVGSRMSWTGRWRGKPFLTIREFWVMTRDLPQWGLDQILGWIDPSFIRIKIDGEPSYTLGLQIHLDPTVAKNQGTSAEHIMIAMTGVRSIPEVVAAPPGIVMATVFAPYRPY